MFETETLETVIKQSGILGTGSPSASGWHIVKCKVCNDHKTRGGFLFEGSSVVYHCFNCGKNCGHAATSQKFTKGMYEVLVAFDVDMSAARKTLFASFGTHAEETPEEIEHRKLLQHPPVIELPDEFVFLSQNNTEHSEAIQYVTNRAIDPLKYGLMISTTTNSKNKWYKRIIVPMYNRSNQVIYYQGRTYANYSKRWDSPPDPKANVLFGYHNLDDQTKDYVVICEGPFDVMSIDGVGILGSEFSPFHIRVLDQCSKKKIVVPQRDSRGYALALQALEHGYNLSFPDIGQAGDINDAVVQYGRLYTEQQILAKVTTTKYEAQLKLGLWCSA